MTYSSPSVHVEWLQVVCELLWLPSSALPPLSSGQILSPRQVVSLLPESLREGRREGGREGGKKGKREGRKGGKGGRKKEGEKRGKRGEGGRF